MLAMLGRATQGVWLTLVSLSLSPGTGSSCPEQRLREALVLGSCGLGEVCSTASVQWSLRKLNVVFIVRLDWFSGIAFRSKARLAPLHGLSHAPSADTDCPFPLSCCELKLNQALTGGQGGTWDFRAFRIMSQSKPFFSRKFLSYLSTYLSIYTVCVCYLLAHSLNVCNNQGLARLKPRSRVSIWFFHMDHRSLCIWSTICFFPCTLLKSWIPSRAARM